ncbi:hypothetical protein CI238_10765 [Colletotrichum incanum]|uniref:Uncharacterized protein n=1 Tax=Colletotrichum incanum TaxID=1573173 RepID=A0A166RWP7_COLIC|nr:hypothetical protein CI238_10765 [Colletotrichum incanum]OHW99032.1 hypothetical protein CSPAE12_02233 [Colletotrichum incanum]
MPLTPSEFETYNRLAVMMEKFHGYFRQTWKRLYRACASPDDSSRMTDDQIIREGLFLSYRLKNHHKIEESSLFPFLARRMPHFQGDEMLLAEQHRQIHGGLEEFQRYLESGRTRKSQLELQVLKSKMDSWGDVLLLHLDQEVDVLGAEDMQEYWTPEEMLEMPT